MSWLKRVFFFFVATYINWRPIVVWCKWLKRSFTGFWRSIKPNYPPNSPSFQENEVDVSIDGNSILLPKNANKEVVCENINQNLLQMGGVNTSRSPKSMYFNLKTDTSVQNVDNKEIDDYFCEYDSTWEDSSEKNECVQQIYRHSKSNRFNRFRIAARDMQQYRHDYPKLTVSYYSSDQDDMPNLQFYLGQRTSSPDGVSIDDFHTKWPRDYSKLERVHSYIQWLFPLQERGMNYQAKELTKKETEAFLRNDTAKERLLQSYKLMLDFYGIKLSNDKTGDVDIAENWSERFENLDRNSHNNLRITRILKCLGTLGFPQHQAPLVKFFLKQTLVMGRLESVKESALNYFIFAVLDKQERRELVKYAYQHYKPKHEFVWCPKRIQRRFEEELNQLSSCGGSIVVSKPQNNVPSQWGHHTGSRQGSKNKSGGDQNHSNDSDPENLPMSQYKTSHSNYGALEARSSDQRKRSAVKRKEGPPMKLSEGPDEDARSDHKEELRKTDGGNE